MPRLFSYGSLQEKDVQLANFGRELTGRPDTLPGYILTQSDYANAEPGSPSDAVEGTIFEITDQELAAADLYEEPASYHRIAVTLQSGTQAWVYVRPVLGPEAQ